MTTFALPLLVHVQADDEQEARELLEAASAAVHTDEEIHGSVLGTEMGLPVEVPDRRVGV